MKLPLKFFFLALMAIVASGTALAQNASDDLQRLLVEARTQLASMQERYTSLHPVVRAQQAKIATLEREISGGPSVDLAATPRPTVTVNFPGGSLTQLSAAIAAAGGTFNIIGNAEDVNAPLLPAVSVRNADPAALMESLNALLHSSNMELTRPRKGNDWIEGTYTVYRRQSSSRDGRALFESFQLGPYLGEHAIDDIVGAIRAAWELDPAHGAVLLRLKFHPQTGILLVSGPEEAIRTVKNVLSQLKRPIVAPGNSPPPPASAKK